MHFAFDVFLFLVGRAGVNEKGEWTSRDAYLRPFAVN